MFLAHIKTEQNCLPKMFESRKINVLQ